MKRIAIDMDGVLADVYKKQIEIHEKLLGRTINLEDLVGKAEFEAFPKGRELCLQSGFFRDLAMMEKSQEVVEKLNSRYEVFIVSAATEYPLSLPEKHDWLAEHFPFIKWQQMVFCGSKQIVKADIMIDDHFKNLDYFDGKTYLFTQPHNQLANVGRHERVSSWKEIEKHLL